MVDCDDNLVIPGVQVDLLDGEGQVLATTQTDKNGAYAFTGLRPGTYSVHEHQPTQYFEHDAYLGSGDGVVVDPDDFAGIDVGSGDNLTDYVFCEVPPAQLSGYVFIDQPTIVFADTPPTPEEIFATHNGTRTPDDTPLAGVTIELRNGETGAPILVGDALPGSYAGAATDPIRVVTDANGHYHFGGLAAGLYARDRDSAGRRHDSIDTPGTTGGFASNPTDLPSSFVAIPTVGAAGSHRSIPCRSGHRRNFAYSAHSRAAFAGEQLQRSADSARAAAHSAASAAIPTDTAATSGATEAACVPAVRAVGSAAAVRAAGARYFAAGYDQFVRRCERLHVAFERCKRGLAAKRDAGRKFAIN